MKKIIILLSALIFIACGGEVSNDGGNTNSEGSSSTSNSNSGTSNSGTSNTISDPGGFGPPVEDSKISNPKV